MMKGSLCLSCGEARAPDLSRNGSSSSAGTSRANLNGLAARSSELDILLNVRLPRLHDDAEFDFGPGSATVVDWVGAKSTVVVGIVDRFVKKPTYLAKAQEESTRKCRQEDQNSCQCFSM